MNILRPLSQVRETIYISEELTCIETTGNPLASSLIPTQMSQPEWRWFNFHISSETVSLHRYS